ncbi:MAG: hypothetical protein M1114_00020 [Candidatus Dependentiae bacterium]|nr:hypothetical protein [Candidatus Dependentiae bacterium]
MKSIYLMITLLVGVGSVRAMEEKKKPIASRFRNYSMPSLKIAYPTQASSSDESRSNAPLSIQRPGSPRPPSDKVAKLKAFSDKKYSSTPSLTAIPETE